MPTALNYCESKENLSLLEKGLVDAIASKTEDDWTVISENNLNKYALSFAQAKEGVDISCFDVTSNCAVDTLKKLRQEDKEAMLVVVSDESVSPLTYMKPSIMPSSLLLKPLTRDSVSKCMEDLLNVFYVNNSQKRNDGRYCVETKDEKVYVPFDKIIYFEAREKKIFLNTKYDETGFYSTLDTIGLSLPSYFVRCHRGFIVNLHYVTKIIPSQNIIYCGDDLIIPLSRGCKNDVINALERLKNE